MPAGSLARDVSAWYEVAARDLAWRRPGTAPWAVLVSEVMLQQTPVGRVLPAYAAWQERWPTPAALAAAAPAEVIRMWGRLGYPRRALRLHDAAAQVVARFGGRLPSAVPDLLSLPGVGDYTARAVAAFAFGQRQPVIDTNVRRVVARSLEGVAHAPVRRSDLDLVAALLPENDAAAARASAALMELGALICTARAPRCTECPLRQSCAWLQRGRPLPSAPPRRQARYAGSDRQVRGRLLEVLRAAAGPVNSDQLARAWPEPVQRERAVAGLVADGLMEPQPEGRWALPSWQAGEPGR